MAVGVETETRLHPLTAYGILRCSAPSPRLRQAAGRYAKCCVCANTNIRIAHVTSVDTALSQDLVCLRYIGVPPKPSRVFGAAHRCRDLPPESNAVHRQKEI